MPARWINKENIVCTTPAHSAGSVVLEISPSVGVSFTNDQVIVDANDFKRLPDV